MSQDGVTSAEDYNNLWEQRFWAKEGGLKAGEAFDAARASPALTHLLASGALDLPGKRVFVPGCGRGYDLVEFLRSGAAQAVGLDFAPGAAEAAQAYLAGELREGEQGRAKVFQGDFFKWTHPEVPQWDVGYDYTFFCALHPSMRGDWASAWARLLAPGARLICLAFPLSHGTQTGPPWPVTLDDYKQLLLPAGFELEKEEPVPPERSHPGRASKECMLVFRRV